MNDHAGNAGRKRWTEGPSDDYKKAHPGWEDEKQPGDTEREPKEQPETEQGQNASAKAGRLHLQFGFDAAIPRPMGTVVEGLLHAGSVTLIYGPPKSGKSFIATDVALSIAAEDDEWMGHKIVRPGPVLYVACEGHAGFWKRLLAAAKSRGWSKETFPKNFILATGRPMLIRANANGATYAPDPSAITQALIEAKEQGLTPVTIIIDTVFRSFGAGQRQRLRTGR